MKGEKKKKKEKSWFQSSTEDNGKGKTVWKRRKCEAESGKIY